MLMIDTLLWAKNGAQFLISMTIVSPITYVNVGVVVILCLHSNDTGATPSAASFASRINTTINQPHHTHPPTHVLHGSCSCFLSGQPANTAKAVFWELVSSCGAKRVCRLYVI